jgi:hypothetical protein
MTLDVHALEGGVCAASKNVASSVLVGGTNRACGGGGRVGVVSIGHLPAIGKLLVPQSAPSGLEDAELSFVGDVRGCPEFIAGVG